MKARKAKIHVVSGADAADGKLETAANTWLAAAGEKELVEWQVVDVGGSPILVILYTE